MTVFRNLTLECNGTVAGYTLYAQVAGTVHADIWAVEYHNLTYLANLTLINSTTLTVSNTGIQSVYFSEEERLNVTAGNALGLHYDEQPGLYPVEITSNSYEMSTGSMLTTSAMYNTTPSIMYARKAVIPFSAQMTSGIMSTFTPAVTTTTAAYGNNTYTQVPTTTQSAYTYTKAVDQTTNEDHYSVIYSETAYGSNVYEGLTLVLEKDQWDVNAYKPLIRPLIKPRK